jgi:hypothetical protein
VTTLDEAVKQFHQLTDPPALASPTDPAPALLAEGAVQ